MGVLLAPILPYYQRHTTIIFKNYAGEILYFHLIKTECEFYGVESGLN
jgi:hypothetical protein